MKRVIPFSALLLLPFASMAIAEPPAPRDTILKAIEVLQEAKATSTDEARSSRITEVVGELENLLESPSDRPATPRESEALRRPATETRRLPVTDPASQRPSLGIDLTDFIDNTRRYQGREITLPLSVRSLVFGGRGESIRDLRGGRVRFQAIADDGNRLDLYVELPRDLQVPKASFADRLLVTFRCTRGNLMEGNVALAIQRPE